MISVIFSDSFTSAWLYGGIVLYGSCRLCFCWI